MAKIIKFKDGREYEVLEESGKYYVCEDGLRFRKSDADIESVSKKKIEKQQEEEWADVDFSDPAPEKEEPKKKSVKTNSRKAKKGEE